MDVSERQALLNLAADERKRQELELSESRVDVDPEDLILAEFALTYGWLAYRDVIDDKITTSRMTLMIEAARKVKYAEQYRQAESVLIGCAAARSDKPVDAFKAMTENIRKSAEVKSE